MKKKLHPKKLLIGIIVIGVILIMSIFRTRVFAPSVEINDEKSFSIEGITSLQVVMTKEKIRIMQAQTNEVRIHYHGTSKQELKLAAKAGGGTVIVGSTRTINCLTGEDLYVDIYLPEDYDRQIVVQTTSGNVTSEKAQADKISINTTSGDITLNDCVGSLDLKASSGNISAAYKTFGEQNINIVTTSGSVQLHLPGTAEFLLEANTSTGKLKSDFAVSTIDSKKMSGQIGTKGNKVVLKTSTGSIDILNKRQTEE